MNSSEQLLRPENMDMIFVYGTLKRGDCRHHVLSRQQFIGEAVTQPLYRLYHLGSYPGVVEVTNLGSEVEGELYAVTPECLEELDEVEDVASGLYERKPIQLQSPYRLIGAEAYFYLGDIRDRPDLGPRWNSPEKE